MAENPQGGEFQKVQTAYEKNVATLAAMLGSDKPLKGKKPQIGQDALGEIVEELFGEDAEAQKQAIKNEIKTLIRKKLDYDQEVKRLQAEMAKVQLEKMKEFNQAANTLTQKIEGVNQLLTDYQSTLRDIIHSAAPTPVEGEEVTTE